MYFLPPKTKTSPFFILSRNPSSIAPIDSPEGAILTFTKDSSGIVPILVI